MMAIIVEEKKYLSNEELSNISKKIRANLNSQPLAISEKAFYISNTFPIPKDVIISRARVEGISIGYNAFVEEKEAKNIKIIKNEQWNMSYEELKRHI